MKTFNLIISIIIITSGFALAEWTPSIWDDFVNNGSASKLPDFSYAGYECGEQYIPNRTDVVADVTDYGATPDDGADDVAGIQAAITATELSGGGVVYFPAGRYDVNVDENNPTFIQLNSGNIVLRGAGSGTGGTVIYLNNMLITDPNESEGEDPVTENAAAISVGHSYTSHWGTDVANITQLTPRGSEIIPVDDSSGINAGDVYLIVSDGADTNELNEYLLYPLDPANWPEFTYANDNFNHFQWLVEVEEVVDATTIKLKQPTRADINPSWTARILKPSMIEEVGVEDMRFESAWTGGYTHHASDELNYYWAGLNMQAVRNGWIKNVVFDDYTDRVPYLNFCKNVTVTDVTVEGNAGHFGPRISFSHDCLIDGVTLNAGRTHSLSVSARSQGNVFRNTAINYASGSASAYQALDFHCGYATENLFELIDSARVQSGGDVVNFPHSSRRNTFWNVKTDDLATPYGDSAAFSQEFFFSFYFSENYVGTRTDSHILTPESIVVGAYHDTVSLEVDQNAADRDTDWVYVEGLNQPNVSPASLYQAQFDMRVPCVEFSEGDFNQDCVTDFADFAEFAGQWLDCSDPANTECGQF